MYSSSSLSLNLWCFGLQENILIPIFLHKNTTYPTVFPRHKKALKGKSANARKTTALNRTIISASVDREPNLQKHFNKYQNTSFFFNSERLVRERVKDKKTTFCVQRA